MLLVKVTVSLVLQATFETTDYSGRTTSSPGMDMERALYSLQIGGICPTGSYYPLGLLFPFYVQLVLLQRENFRGHLAKHHTLISYTMLLLLRLLSHLSPSSYLFKRETIHTI